MQLPKVSMEIFVTYSDILALKGVGEYTAAAICSFAYNLPYAVVDGNVYRVLSRYLGIQTPIDSTEGKSCLLHWRVSSLINQNLEHNQAIMDFGALQCTPASPGAAYVALAGDADAPAAIAQARALAAEGRPVIVDVAIDYSRPPPSPGLARSSSAARFRSGRSAALRAAHGGAALFVARRRRDRA